MKNGTKYLGIAIFVMLVTLLIFPSISPALAEPQKELPINKYGWLDQIVFFREPDRAKALDELKKGDMNAYFIDISDPDLYREIRESPELSYDFSYGLYYDLTFNPYGPKFKNGKLNPFSDPKIREAMNYVIDRDYIVDEILGGLGVPKFTCFVKAMPEGQRYADVINRIEDAYAYDFEKGKAIITAEMEKLGATLKGGKWYYKGEPVVLNFLIRVEDARKQIGDYIANQLEKLGFTVNRMYKTSRESAPYWILGDPSEGTWNLYTGGWITTAVVRDESDNFLFFYTPEGLPWSPLWQAYKPSPEFYNITKRLAERNFKSIEERNKLMEEAFWLAMKDSARIWIVDQTAVWARRKSLYLVADKAAGYANQAWAYFINRNMKMGGTAKIGSAEVIIDPWNPIAGSDWIYDSMIYDYGSEDNAFVLSPQNGLPIPINVKTVTMEVEKGAPTTSNSETKDWFNLTFVDKVTVPPDAWYAWDVKNQKMITAGEAGVKEAKVKFVVNYGPQLNKTAYHDGSKRTLADFILPWIITFERANPSSEIYDEDSVPSFETYRNQFVAWRIVSKDPLVVEYYVNYIALDAEVIAYNFALWPSEPWHMIATGILAEKSKELAFGQTKAQKLDVEWMNYIAGPSLKILSKDLDQAYNEGYIPFKNFLGKYVTTAEAKRRYKLLKSFYEKHGHFWVADGPYYVDRVDAIAHTALLKSIRLLPYKLEKPARFISEFMIYPYVTVAFGYDKAIYWKYFPAKEIKYGPEGVSLVLGGPAVNIHTKVAFEKVGIKLTGSTLTLPNRRTYRSQWGKVGYGIATIIGDNLYVAGSTRFGTEAALLYILKNRANKGLVVVKWQDKNGDSKVSLDEISVVFEKL